MVAKQVMCIRQGLIRRLMLCVVLLAVFTPLFTKANVCERLSARAYGVTDVTNGSNAKSAVVLRNGSKRYTAEQLRAALGLPIETTDGAGPDIVIRIGADFRGFATDVATR